MPAAAQTFVGEYELVTINGEAGEGPVSLKLSAVEGKPDTLGLMARVANTLRGQVTISDPQGEHTATAKGMLASTRMMGPPTLMKVEGALALGLDDGCPMKLMNDQLTITSGSDVMIFKRK